MGQIAGPFSSHGSWAIFSRNLWPAHVHFCKIRRSLSPVASAGDCTQLTTLLLLAHAACPQQDCPLFVRHSKIVHATCDVVRGLWSLSEGSVRRDRRWNANGGSVGQFLNKAGSVGRVKAEVVGEVVDNDYNLEKLLFLLFFFYYKKMWSSAAPPYFRKMFRWADPSCSSPSHPSQCDLHWSPGHVDLSARREIKF